MSIVILQGDARELFKRIGSDSIDMIFTDPPYGHNNNNNGDLIHRWEAALGRPPSDSHSSQGTEARPIANDGAEANELFQEVLPEFKRVLKASCCCCCCCGGGGPDPQFARWSLWLDKALTFKQMVVWDKGPMGMGWHYRRSYETVLVAHKGQTCRWYDDTGSVENIIRPHHRGISKIIPQADDHPTPKPWQLAAHFIQLHTQEGDLVLDPFMGGGSTAIACMMTNRNFIGFEIEPRWIELAERRIADANPSLFGSYPSGQNRDSARGCA